MSGAGQRLRSGAKRAVSALVGEGTTRLLLRLHHVPALIRRFGLRDGLRLARQILLPRGGLIEVRLPGESQPLVLRAATSDIPTFEQIFVYEEYALPFLDLRPALIVDAGANIGLSVRYFVSRFPGARIIAVEPDRSNLDLLRRNTAAFPNVALRHAALWNREQRLAISNPDAEKWAIRVGESGPGPEVAGLTVGGLLAEAGGEVIDLLKIDIEGAEVEVFDGSAAAWLPRVGALIIELHDDLRPGCSTAFYSATRPFTFREFRSGENVVLVRHAATASRNPPAQEPLAQPS